jgi:hypothetical protein
MARCSWWRPFSRLGGCADGCGARFGRWGARSAVLDVVVRRDAVLEVVVRRCAVPEVVVRRDAVLEGVVRRGALRGCCPRRCGGSGLAVW